ncbi:MULTISPECIES: helix-turn-helix domain-containing protein [unclassified Janibacter]|uniref:arsenate reductase/protein-tyrosine-phosphatase family protein n=1 Tax=unclassified Janibacter TaxID=2649294 RepID=UPI003CFE65FD
MNVEQTPEGQSLERRAATHAALGDPTRLRIVDVLAVGDVSASELGSALEVPSNLLAHHLRTLEAAGLVVRRRSEGDARRSYLSLVREALPADVAGVGLPVPGRVLFVCTANTARSHLAAALWRRESRIEAGSAGTHPGERIHPGAVETAQRHALPLRRTRPRLLDDELREGDHVITVCDRAHEELAGHGWTHWSIPDPVAVGSQSAFDAACDELAPRIASLAAHLRSA